MMSSFAMGPRDKGWNSKLENPKIQNQRPSLQHRGLSLTMTTHDDAAVVEEHLLRWEFL